VADGISCDVDDQVMVEAIRSLASDGINAANRRAVLKTARIGNQELKAATRGAMFNEPGGYDPFKAANFRRPRDSTRGGGISAGTGYTQEGSFDRFRSTGTKPRFRKTGSYAGTEMGFGMVQVAAAGTDPLFPAITEAEMVAEVKKRGL
jgi:hypothetical protein